MKLFSIILLISVTAFSFVYMQYYYIYGDENLAVINTGLDQGFDDHMFKSPDNHEYAILNKDEDLKIENATSVDRFQYGYTNDASQEYPEPANIENFKDEYDDLMEKVYQAEGEDKVILLRSIWGVVSDVGVDQNLYALLILDLISPDESVRKIAGHMLSDLYHVKSQDEMHLQGLIDKTNLAKYQSNQIQVDGNLKDAAQITDLDELTDLKKSIQELRELAITHENADVRNLVYLHLTDISPENAVEVIKYQLNNGDTEERYIAVEKLRSLIGDVDSVYIHEALNLAKNDYDPQVYEFAHKLAGLID